MELRRYRPEDLPELAALFYDTIHTINRRDYTAEQANAWSGPRGRLLAQGDFFLRQFTLVAVEDGQILGYGNLDEFGYLDHLFVHRNAQGRGVATALCAALEEYHFARGGQSVTVHASLTALSFFIHRGYVLLRTQQVERQGVALTNCVMEKPYSQGL